MTTQQLIKVFFLHFFDLLTKAAHIDISKPPHNGQNPKNFLLNFFSYLQHHSPRGFLPTFTRTTPNFYLIIIYLG